MSKRTAKRAAAIGAVLALAAAPAALAAKPDNPGSQGQSHAGSHSKKGGKAVVTYVFKGTYLGGGDVDVNKGNAHSKKAGLVGTTVSFDLSSAKLTVADTNGDTVVDENDLVVNDRVVVKARLSRKDPGTGPYTAKHVVDQTNPPGSSAG